MNAPNDWQTTNFVINTGGVGRPNSVRGHDFNVTYDQLKLRGFTLTQQYDVDDFLTGIVLSSSGKCSLKHNALACA